MTLPDPIAITARLVSAFDDLGIRYLVGGSVASSMHGVPRTTQDADVVAELRVEHVAPLVEALEKDFFIEAGAVRDAVLRRGSFNVIYLPTIFKVDVFIRKSGDYAELEMDRRQLLRVSDQPPLDLAFASPEDTVLQKLVWFRKGAGVSERQWLDALGVAKVQADSLDRTYLVTWAERLGCADLLQRLLDESSG